MSISSGCGCRRSNLAVDVVVRDGHDVLVVVAVADVVDGGGGVGGVGGAVGRSLRTAFQGAGQPVSRGGGGIQLVCSALD